MRLLYIDIDTLRPDHLGCYGYHRGTSPNIDALAERAVVFDNVHASDVPCLPSRTALLTGRFGIHNGVVNHGGTDADPTIEGAARGFWSRLQMESFPSRLRRAGLHTVSISSFAHRHSAFHWYAGLDEALDVGKYGMEIADDVHRIAAEWLQRRGREDDWYLHLHIWDPHTPYRAPPSWGEPFADDPLPAWLTEAVREVHWHGSGPHSAQEANGYAPKPLLATQFPRQPQSIPDMAHVRRMFDGYDTGVRVADDFVGRILNQLADLGVLEETAIMVSSDHGETLGELNVYGDHQTADQFTTRVPMILHWPGLAGGTRRSSFCYPVDVTASLLELLGERVPERWDGRSFAAALKAGEDAGRDHLVVSQAAWACQRGVRFGSWMYILSRHDAYHLYPREMLFDLASDPHQQHSLHASRADVLAKGRMLLAEWMREQLGDGGRDPHDNVMREGGPFHVRGHLPEYAARLRATGRGGLADRLLSRSEPVGP
jgi:arylsulfatase A-like enzyme